MTVRRVSVELAYESSTLSSLPKFGGIVLAGTHSACNRKSGVRLSVPPPFCYFYSNSITPAGNNYWPT